MKKTIVEHRAEATLNKVFRYPEGVMSRREWLNMCRVKGATVEEKQVRNYAAEEKLRTHLEGIKNDIPHGNPNYPTTKKYLEDKAALTAGIYKTEYRLNLPNNSLYDITKTEYDYFNSMELAEDINTQKTELDYKIEAGIATDKEIEEAEDDNLEFFRKYSS